MDRLVKNTQKSSRTSVRWLIAGTLLIACLAIGYFGFPYYESGAEQFLEWIESQGAWAPIIFTGTVSLAVVTLLPGVAFSLAAGFLFGLVRGVLYMWIGTFTGAAIAFLVGRSFLGERFVRFAERHQKLDIVNDALRLEGWKLVMLTRMVPFFPFKLSNYIFGCAGFSLKHFCIGTAIGTLPIMIFNVYLGSLAGDLTSLGADAAPSTPLRWAVNIGGLLVLGLGLAYIVHIARRALHTALSEPASSDPVKSES